MIHDNKEILKKANAAISAGDYEGFLSFCDEDTQWNFVGDRKLSGKEEVREWMKDAYTEPPNFNVLQLIGEGDFVTAVGQITIRDQNGENADYSYCDVWRFRDGKMVELKAFVIRE